MPMIPILLIIGLQTKDPTSGVFCFCSQECRNVFLGHCPRSTYEGRPMILAYGNAETTGGDDICDECFGIIPITP